MRFLFLSIILFVCSAVKGQLYYSLEIKTSINGNEKVVVPNCEVTIETRDSIYKYGRTNEKGILKIDSIPVGQLYGFKINHPSYLPKLALLDLTNTVKKRHLKKRQNFLALMDSFPPKSCFTRMDTVPIVEFTLEEYGFLSWKFIRNTWIYKVEELCSDSLSFDDAYRYTYLVESSQEKAKNQQYVSAVLDINAALEIKYDEDLIEAKKQLLVLALIKHKMKAAAEKREEKDE